MGTYARPSRLLKVRITGRGARWSTGPRAARLHVGAGGPGGSRGPGRSRSTGRRGACATSRVTGERATRHPRPTMTAAVLLVALIAATPLLCPGEVCCSLIVL